MRYTLPVAQARSTFSVLRATSAILGLYAGNMKFNTQSEERFMVLQHDAQFHLCLLLHIMCNKKYSDSNIKC